MIVVLYGGLVGFALGLTGGGGSIFAVPLLLYGLGLPLREAITVSLVVVGATALYGAILQRKFVRPWPGVVFGVGGILGAPAGAWLGARLPDSWTLLLFAGLMLFIAGRMWRGGNAEGVVPGRFACRVEPGGEIAFHWACAAKLVGAGFVTGILSGTFGVGGGFLVVPALLLVTRMPFERALATSLVCIAMISVSAFVSNFIKIEVFPYAMAGWFFVGGTAGMTLGATIKKLLSGLILRRSFAVAMAGIAVWMGLKTIFV